MTLTRRIKWTIPVRRPFAVAGLLALACGGDFTSRADGDAGPGAGGDAGESGGTSNGGRGGRSGSGGTASTGGVTVSGGRTGTGGAIVQGGSASTGGRVGTGGRTAAGGSAATGGFVGTGGATGGAMGNGGSIGAGGVSASGGFIGAGGVNASGGFIGAGGVNASGGFIGAGGVNAAGGFVGAGGAGTGGTPGAGGSGPECGMGDVECDPPGPRRCGNDGTWEDTQCGPLVASDVVDIDVSPLPGFAVDMGFRCKALSVCGVQQNCVYFSEFLGSRQSGDDPTYSDGAELADGQAVKVRIDGGAASQCGNPPITLAAGEGIAVVLSDGRRVHVVFPAFTGDSLTLYVREDGATFYDAALSQRAQ